jgi:hypothetical protein
MLTHGKPLPIHQIELRVGQVSELFNSMDPTPFHERGLDRDAQAYLESWALEFAAESRFRIIVHVANMPEADPQPEIERAIHHHFHTCAEMSVRALRTLLLEGRIALLVGLGVLALCLLGADLLSAPAATSPALKVLRESLLIGGWVAMWKPMNTYLYEWWPLVRRRRIYQRLAHALVHVTPSADRVPPAQVHPGGISAD